MPDWLGKNFHTSLRMALPDNRTNGIWSCRIKTLKAAGMAAAIVFRDIRRKKKQSSPFEGSLCYPHENTHILIDANAVPRGGERNGRLGKERKGIRNQIGGRNG
jgi:hypothetical protein